MNMETKVMLMSMVVKLYLIFCIIISAFGMQNECNDSLISEIAIDKINIISEEINADKTRENIILSEKTTVWTTLSSTATKVGVDLGSIHLVTALIFRGEENLGTRDLSDINIGYSTENNLTMSYYKDKEGKAYVIDGAIIGGSIKQVIFDPPFYARFVVLTLFTGETIDNVIAFQFDLLGCKITECNDSLISEIAIDKINIWTADDNAYNTRGNIRLSEKTTVWTAFSLHATKILVDLGSIHLVTALIFRGEENFGTRDLSDINIGYSTEKPEYNMSYYIDKEGKLTAFDGAIIGTSIKQVIFNPPFYARFLVFLLYCRGSAGCDISFQFDLLGCKLTESSPEITTEITTESITEITTKSTEIPCNDILNVFIGNIGMGEICDNEYYIRIMFNESGLYKIRSVNVTITNEEVLEAMDMTEDVRISFNTKKRSIRNYKKDGPNRIFNTYEETGSRFRSMESFILCIYAIDFDDIEVYKYFTIEVRGCVSGGFIQEQDD